MKRNINPYKVISWDFNSDNIEYYDIMPFLIDSYKKIKKNKPKTFDEIKEFIINESRYRFWSRCEYEVIITGWPKQKREVKIDIFEQIMKNIDVITTHFMSHF